MWMIVAKLWKLVGVAEGEERREVGEGGENMLVSLRFHFLSSRVGIQELMVFWR